MAWRDRIAKALALPAGATTQTADQIMGQSPQSGTTAVPLERDPLDWTVPFAPGRPLVPSLINPPREDGRTGPRRYEFPVAWNLQVTEQRVVPFRLLRDVADGSDLVRKCVEVVKAAVSGMEWEIVPQTSAVERMLADNPSMGTASASRVAREQLAPEISRCKDFWRMPDRINGMSFPEWVGMAVEEMLVIDALSIYPNRNLGDDNLHSLEILDGTTIKPLLDDRGGRPIPPHAAYQQILWGFPRGEFTASADADGEFTVDDLVYAPRTRRPFTPYGYSAVERALPMIDLYMKRIQWLRTEFTDGVTPEMLIKSDATYGGNPEILRGYERVFNDDLSGKTENRKRMRLLPEGMDPVFPPGIDAKYRAEFDEYLVKQVCSHFGVLPTQIGFAPRNGLGGSGVQEGEQLSAEIIGLRPVVLWLTDLLNQLSYRFLNMPRDLGFTLTSGEQEDGLQQVQKRQIQIQSGELTLNEARAESGMPLFTFPEADMPLVPSNMVPLSEVEELIGVAAPEPEVNVEVEGESGIDDVAAKAAEMDAFVRWSKTARTRPFNFDYATAQQADMLNGLVKVDADAARDLAMLLKAEDAHTPPQGVRDAAARALEWVREGRPGGTAVGKKRAADLARGASVSRETVGRMVSFFARHEVDKKAEGFNRGEDGYPSPGRVAWELWGGDAGKRWADGILEREKAREGA